MRESTVAIEVVVHYVAFDYFICLCVHVDNTVAHRALTSCDSQLSNNTVVFVVAQLAKCRCPETNDHS